MTSMSDREYRLTFGQQYRREPHPVVGRLIHPDGWVKVMAPDYTTAREMALRFFGASWSNLYEDITEFPWEDTFPLGKLGVLRYAFSADDSKRRVIFSSLGSWEPT